MKKYKYVVLDLHNLFWRSITKSFDKKKIISEAVIYNGAVTLFLNRVKELLNNYAYGDSIVYFLADNPESHINIRKIISNGTYKHSRELEKLPKNIYKTLNIIIEILKSYSDNFRILQNDNCEADDLTFPLKESLTIDKQNNCLFISADLDWARNIDEFCDWYNYFTVHNISTFKEKYKFSPEGKTIQLWKAIKGDNSDCIVNAVPHLPSEILVDILNRFKDVDTLFENLWNQDYPEEWKIKIKGVEANIRLNYQLVDFILLNEDVDNYSYVCKKNAKKLKFWFDILSIPYTFVTEKVEKVNCFKKKKYKRI